MNVEVLSLQVPGWRTEAWLLKAANGDHFVASGVNAMFSGWEVLVFRSDEKGNVDDWLEVAGGRGMTHDEAVQDLALTLEGEGARS